MVLVYNGEIYNFKALRPESTSDGEALVPLYLQRGDLFTRRWFNGGGPEAPLATQIFFGDKMGLGESCWLNYVANLS